MLNNLPDPVEMPAMLCWSITLGAVPHVIARVLAFVVFVHFLSPTLNANANQSSKLVGAVSGQAWCVERAVGADMLAIVLQVLHEGRRASSFSVTAGAGSVERIGSMHTCAKSPLMSWQHFGPTAAEPAKNIEYRITIAREVRRQYARL
ncbi:hypothetical protein [Rhizobium sp. CECT 9324]|uniref:hypothetical protein n=1 Tax=Rhizobium sp. CECT 9324 TaxID=2845820 RepID=UPI001E64A7A9|nr:hypothetical protein [Rhizobium sp. CECT 9324]CAH0342907.1 hypothetical protein RHI9324_04639 [Rhizobium sp. CECT 9324]